MSYRGKKEGEYGANRKSSSSHSSGTFRKIPCRFNDSFFEATERRHQAEMEARELARSQRPVIETKPIPKFSTWEEADTFFEQRVQAYPNKNEYLSSAEYPALYSELERLRKIKNQAFGEVGQAKMREMGIRAGDIVESVQFNPWGMEFARKGKVVVGKDGIPEVKLTQNDIDSKKTVTWHMGFKKVASFVSLLDTNKREYTDNLKKGREIDASQFLPYLDKNVVIESIHGKQISGKIVRGTNGLMIFPKNSRNKGHYVTAGLLDGFAATITVRKIKLV